jgi:uncharacterized protein (DUF924 family)
MTFTSPRLVALGVLMAVFAAPSCVDGPTLQPRTDIKMTSTAIAEKPIATSAEALEVVAFWREAGPSMWFAKDDAFDRKFRDRFIRLHEAAARGELKSWEQTSDGVLALLILLDQFPRNSFRNTPRMYETDATARAVADRAILAGLDKAVPVELRTFVYIPFGHSESLADQERGLALTRSISETEFQHAKHHYDIVARFGRFPHRNPILGRAMRPEEQKYLDEGGYKG